MSQAVKYIFGFIIFTRQEFGLNEYRHIGWHLAFLDIN